ncbi:DEAD/DEAH box helicase domain protein [Haliangium ochraceum DSM 14365]|uniref:Probable DNA 3'-5' helicase RecG n=1 Tax=Haliangium ochraceum (strain DSM 14365 / JCM 11303 / SMP-2) TaxID=502025 RepID=D0LI39_HALO1|nr:DEAD/DEAH box helicase domain protein [Haliangium ochraceum DSM 14365]
MHARRNSGYTRPVVRTSSSSPVAADTAALDAPVTTLPGIGPSLSARLAERGLHTLGDLLWLVPRRYDDARRVTPLGQAIAEARREPSARTTTLGVVLASRFHRRGRKRWFDARLAGTDDPEARLLVRWFGARESLAKRFPKGARVVLSGRLDCRTVGAEMQNPDILATTTAGGDRVSTAGGDILTRYPDVPGVAAATLAKACREAVRRGLSQVVDAVPAALAARLDLVPLSEALRHLHEPPAGLSVDEVAALDSADSAWHRRLAFEELFLLGLVVARRRHLHRLGRAVPCPALPWQERAELLGRALPYQLTGAQQRAIEIIGRELAEAVPMNRLLQGDVGAGKTAVAFAAAQQACSAGRQVAFMAPTALLAEQHAATLMPWCIALGMRATLLTAATPRKTRAEVLALLRAHQLDLVIGTHALLSEGVDFAALGLVIIDEQHRFGVAQRVGLRAKGEGEGDSAVPDENVRSSEKDASDAGGSPHLLVMTATPIPRTLALTAYGDLDVTVLDELPPGRQPPRTLVLAGSDGRDRAHAMVRERLQAGERIFVVCPLVEPAEGERDAETAPADSLQGQAQARADATTTAERLQRTFAPARVGLVHGRMVQAERDRVMGDFRAGRVDILVATTVIEVGVDVPEATVMVILEAHCFGLAQLHQLRGRVGRGGGSSLCLLMTRRQRTAEAEQRLATMAATCDGFRIAEEDLRLRGPGELLGVRQSGLPRLRFGDLRAHGALLVAARDAAETLLAADPELRDPAHAGTRRALRERLRELGESSVFGAESG